MSETKRGPIINFLLHQELASSLIHANAILLAVSIFNLFAAVAILGSMYSFSANSTTYREDVPLEIQNTLPPEILKNIPSRNYAR